MIALFYGVQSCPGALGWSQLHPNLPASQKLNLNYPEPRRFWAAKLKNMLHYNLDVSKLCERKNTWGKNTGENAHSESTAWEKLPKELVFQREGLFQRARRKQPDGNSWEQYPRQRKYTNAPSLGSAGCFRTWWHHCVYTVVTEARTLRRLGLHHSE